MPILTTERLYKAVKNKTALLSDFTELDHSRPFIPEHLTQLYYTAYYKPLPREIKLRYNQLFALRAIEQLMTLESRFIAQVIQRSQHTSVLRNNTQLQYCMQEMISEEVEHYKMFHTLNKLAEPVIYKQHELYFARMTGIEKMVLGLLARLPGIMPFLLMILLILEEFSTYISRQMLQAGETDLGLLEKNFIKAHREHLKDESRHVAICANALNKLLSVTSTRTRTFNARLLHLFMKQYMTPRHGGVRVIEHLCREFPELAGQNNQMQYAIRQQSPDPLIWGAVQSETAMPVTHQIMQLYPEFSLPDQAGGKND